MNDGRQELERFWRRAVHLAQGAALGGAAALYLLGGRGPALGLLLGSLVSMLRFHLRYRSLRRGPSTGALVRLRLLNYLLSGAALAVAFTFSEVISPWTTIAGLLVMNVSVIISELSCGRGRVARSAEPESSSD